ncbi:MAG: PAS domain-containing protein [Candidatus Omnitrophota bacterium]
MSEQNSAEEKLSREIDRLKHKLAIFEHAAKEQFTQTGENQIISSILNAVPHAIVGLIDRKIVFVNNAVKSVFNIEAKQAIGQSTRMFYRNDEDYKRIGEIFYPVLEGKACYLQEFPCRTLDGRDIICNVSAARFGDTLQDKTIVVMYEDITLRKQTEKELLKSNIFLKNIIESLAHPFYVINVDDYSIALANSYAYHAGEEGATKCYTLTHQRDNPCSGTEHLCPLEQVKQIKKTVTVEHIHEDREGNKRFVEINCYPIFDDQGQVKQVIEYALDISERKNAEAELKQSATDWHRTFDSINDLIFIQDTNNVIVRVNKAFAQHLGMEPNKIEGRKCYELWHKTNSPWSTCPMELTKKDRQMHTAEIEDPNIGTPLRITTSPIFDSNGDMVGSVHIAKDITQERQATKELKRKMHDLEIFSKSAVGREMKMMEMKKKIQDLEQQIQDLEQQIQNLEKRILTDKEQET